MEIEEIQNFEKVTPSCGRQKCNQYHNNIISDQRHPSQNMISKRFLQVSNHEDREYITIKIKLHGDKFTNEQLQIWADQWYTFLE